MDGRMDGKTEGRKTLSLRFSSNRRGTISTKSKSKTEYNKVYNPDIS